MEEVKNNTVEFKESPKQNPEIEAKELPKEYTFTEKLDMKINGVAQYVATLESAIAQRFSGINASLNILFEEIFKDCPQVKEESIKKEEGKDYAKIVGQFYYTKNSQVVKIITVDTGWDIVDQQPAEPETIDGKQYETATFTFKFSGIVPNAEYPTTYSTVCVVGTNPFMKLREYLFSLTDNKIIM